MKKFQSTLWLFHPFRILRQGHSLNFTSKLHSWNESENGTEFLITNHSSNRLFPDQQDFTRIFLLIALFLFSIPCSVFLHGRRIWWCFEKRPNLVLLNLEKLNFAAKFWPIQYFFISSIYSKRNIIAIKSIMSKQIDFLMKIVLKCLRFF